MTEPHIAEHRTHGWWCACGGFNGEAMERVAACRACAKPRSSSQRFLLERASEDREELLGFASRRAIGVLQRAHALGPDAGEVMQALDRAMDSMRAPSLFVPVRAEDLVPRFTYAPDVELGMQAIRLLAEHEWSGSEDGALCRECLSTKPDAGHWEGCVWGKILQLTRPGRVLVGIDPASGADVGAEVTMVVGADGAASVTHVATTRDNSDCCVVCGVPYARLRTGPECPSGALHGTKRGPVCYQHSCTLCVDPELAKV